MTLRTPSPSLPIFNFQLPVPCPVHYRPTHLEILAEAHARDVARTGQIKRAYLRHTYVPRAASFAFAVHISSLLIDLFFSPSSTLRSPATFFRSFSFSFSPSTRFSTPLLGHPPHLLVFIYASHRPPPLHHFYFRRSTSNNLYFYCHNQFN